MKCPFFHNYYYFQASLAAICAFIYRNNISNDKILLLESRYARYNSFIGSIMRISYITIYGHVYPSSWLPLAIVYIKHYKVSALKQRRRIVWDPHSLSPCLSWKMDDSRPSTSRGPLPPQPPATQHCGVIVKIVKSTVIFFLVLQKTRFVVFYCGESQYFMLNLIIIVCTSRKHSENIFYIICVGIMYAKVRKIITLVHSWAVLSNCSSNQAQNSV